MNNRFESRLEELAGYFALAVGGFPVIVRKQETKSDIAPTKLGKGESSQKCETFH